MDTLKKKMDTYKNKEVLTKYTELGNGIKSQIKKIKS